MWASLLRRVLIAGLLSFASFGASAQSFDVLLRKADGIRTSDTAQFNRILTRLDEAANRATPAQRMQLRLMHAYQPLLAGDYQASIRQLKLLLAMNPDVDVRYRAGAILANNYALTRQFSEGLAVMQRTLVLSGRVRDPVTRQQGLLVAAILYNQVGQYRLGLKYADQVLSEPATGRNQCISGGLRIEALQNLGTVPSDEDILAVIHLCQTHHEGIPSGLVVSYLARKWYADGRVNAAIKLLAENLAKAETTHYPRLIGEIRSLLAELLLAKGDLLGAKQNANAAIAQKVGIAKTPALVMAYKTLYEIAERHHDPVAALAYYRDYAEADKAYLNEVKARELAYQIVRQENQEKTQQIELLNRQNAVLQLQQRVGQASAQNSRLLLLLMGLLAASIGFWAYKTRRVHSSLRHMAEIDALTGICNRHHFTLQAERTLAQCAVAGEPAALLMFDLDHFKSINDSYGHTTGDWVLKRVADTCKHFCRRIDHLGRLGGEEFAILLHGCDLHVATRLAEDCRVRIAGIDTNESGYRFTVTASFGVSASSLSGYDLAKLLSHADLMLYRAKREGRNRVRTYAPDMPITLRPQAGENSSAHVDGPVAEAPSGNQAS